MTGRSSSATWSSQDSSTQLSCNIPVIFHTQHANPQAASQALDRSYSTTADAPGASTAAGTFTSHSSPPLCLAELQQVAMDIKSTLSAAISDLKTDIRTVASRLEHVEAAAMTHGQPSSRSKKRPCPAPDGHAQAHGGPQYQGPQAQSAS